MGLRRLRAVVALAAMLGVMAGPGHAAKDSAVATSGLPIPRYVSLKSDHVNVRAGPTKDNDVAWVYTRSGWVYHSMLSGRRTAVITMKSKEELAPLYDRADRESAVAAKLQAGVVAQVKKCSNGWCRITGNGFDGFIEQQRLWGVYADEKVE